MTSNPVVPDSHADLLSRPVLAHVATIGPDGAPQCDVMWFDWDGERIRLPHPSDRQKAHRLQREPRVALSIADPDDPYRFIEVRGTVAGIEADDEKASFYGSLEEHYGKAYDITDPEARVIVVVKPTAFIATTAGRTHRTS